MLSSLAFFTPDIVAVLIPGLSWNGRFNSCYCCFLSFFFLVSFFLLREFEFFFFLWFIVRAR